LVTFAELPLSPKVIKAVEDAGYTEPTPIQEQAIPHVMAGKDVLGIAQTGTGKTASFVLPMITKLERGRARARMPRTLILEPTRELAAQVDENFQKYGKHHKLQVALLIGGVSFDDQDRKLERGADVLIATPGRLLDHSERGKLLLNGVDILVIDEADRMLDMGFIPDIERIAGLIPFTRQTLFFSATMPPEIARLADQFLSAPVRIEVARASSTAATVEQKLLKTGSKDFEKRAALRELLKAQDDIKNGIIFCNRKRDVATLFRSLDKHGFSVGALHGDMDQYSRTQTLEGFRNNQIQLLVASDVAARGLDIPDVSHVFNFDVPIHAEDYVHRIGRTGRAGRSGKAFTLVDRTVMKYLESVEKLIDKKLDYVEGIAAPKAEDTGEEETRQTRGGRRDRRSRRDKGRDDAPKRAEKADKDASADASSSGSDSPRSDAPKSESAKADDRNDGKDRSRENKQAVRAANDDQAGGGRDRKKKRDRKQDDTPVGFGDDIPAFMMIGR
jgi:superfamily II DNA/RNA helicase